MRREQDMKVNQPRTEIGKGKQRAQTPFYDSDEDDGEFLNNWDNDDDGLPAHIPGLRPVDPPIHVQVPPTHVTQFVPPPAVSSVNDREPPAWAKGFFDNLSQTFPTKEEVMQLQRASNEAMNVFAGACRELTAHIIELQHHISRLGATPKFAINEYTEFAKALLSTSQQIETARAQYAPILPILPGLADRSGTVSVTSSNPGSIHPPTMPAAASAPSNEAVYVPVIQPSVPVAATSVASRSTDDLLREISELKRQLGSRAQI
jgi:hypothetical protein